MELAAAFKDVKYEELLIILLRLRPEQDDIFFSFDTPQKINIEAYMDRNSVQCQSGAIRFAHRPQPFCI
jgi:hypothetical protein